MAGSWNHIVDDDGRFDYDDVTGELGTVQNLGDAIEALEECFGMIQYLARGVATMRAATTTREEVIEEARRRYRDGLGTVWHATGGPDAPDS